MDEFEAKDFEAACRRDWESNATLHSQFYDFENYLYYRRAEAEGRIRCIAGHGRLPVGAHR